MALSARELLLIVRAQNQASGALKRVAGDMRAMGRMRSLQLRQNQLAINQANLMRQRQAALNELQSITSGSRAAGFQARGNAILRQRAAIERTMLRNADYQKKVGNDLFRNTTQRLALEERLGRALHRQEIFARRQAEAAKAASKATRDASGRFAKRAPVDPDLLRGAELRATRLASVVDLLGRRLTSNADRTKELNRTMEAHKRNLDGARAGMAANAAASRKLAIDQGTAAKRAAVLQSELAGVGQRLEHNRNQMRELNREISNQRWERVSMGARTLGHLGRVAALAGVVTVGAFGVMADGAAKYETAATRVATQTGKIGTGAETVVKNAKILGPALREIFADSTSSIEQVTEAGYDLFSTIDQIGESTKGLKTGVGMLHLFSDAAIAGGTDIETVGNGVVSVLSAFKEMPQTTEQVRKVLNRMFAAVRFGRIDFAEFAKSMETTTPAAKAASQSFDTMAGTLAFATKPLGAAFSRVGFARLVEQLSRSKFIDNLKEAGVTITDTRGRLLQLPTVIKKITDKFPKLKQGGIALSQFFKEMSKTEGTIQARRLFTFLATDLDGYNRILGKTTRDNSQFDRDLKAMEQTTGVRWQKLINQFKAFALMLGADVLPELLRLQPYIERFVNWFKSLSNETRGQYARWALIAGGIALVGGALAAVAGGALSFIGLLGRLGGGLNLLKFGLIGAIAYLVLFKQDWADIGDMAGMGINAATSSVQGFLVASAAMLLMMGKIRKTATATRVAFAAGQGAAGGGFLPMMFGGAGRGVGAVKTLRMMNQEMKAAKVMGTGARYLRMAGAAALFLPGPLKLAAVALAGFGTAAFLWNRHVKQMADEAKRVRTEFNQFAAPFRQATSAAGAVGRLMGDFRSAKAASLDVRELKIQIQQTWAELRKTPPGFSKDMLRVQLERLKMNLEDAQTAYRRLTMASTSSFRSAERFSKAQNLMDQQRVRITNEIAKKQAELGRLQAMHPEADPTGQGFVAKRAAELTRQIQNLQRNLDTLGIKGQAAAAKFDAAFAKSVSNMQRAALLPKNIGDNAIRAAEAFFRSSGKRLTPKNLRVFFKAYLDPKSNIAGQIASAARKAKTQDIKFKAKVEIAQAKATLDEAKFQRALPKGTTVSWKLDEKAQNAAQAATKTWGQVNAIVTKPHQLKVDPPGNLGGIGAGISAGIQAGMNDVVQTVKIFKTTWLQELEIHSPSRWFAREIGAPSAEGLAKGMMDKMLELAPQAALTMSLFTSPMLQKLQQDIDRAKEIVEELGDLAGKQARKIADARDNTYASKDKSKNAKAMAKRIKEIKSDIKLEREDLEKELQGLRRVMRMTDLIHDMESTAQSMKAWNDNMARLADRRVPRRLLDDLAEMGIEGARYLALLAGATEKELRRFVRAWNMAERQRRRSMRTTVEEELDGTKNAVEAGGQALLDKWNEIKSELESLYGGINTDVMNAAAEYNSNLAGFFSGSFGDLFSGVNDRMQAQTDSANEAIRRHNEELQAALDDYRQKVDEMRDKLEQAFGQLFHGPWLDSEELREKLDWGYVLNSRDLIKDLQMQLDQFKKWLGALSSLGARGLPPELLEMLRSLGPEALPMLLALQNMTDEELSEYLALWKEKGDIIANEVSKIPGVIGEMMTEMIGVMKATMGDLTADLQSQLDAFRSWRTDLGALLARGVPREMFDELMNLGPDAAEWIHILATATDAELANYITLWQQKAAEIAAAVDEFSKATTPQEILDAMKKQAMGFVAFDELLQELVNKGLPKELIDQLRALGPDAVPYLQALVDMSKPELDEYVKLWNTGHQQIADSTQTFFDAQLAAWTAHGANVATALIAGVMSEQEALLSFFRNLFQGLLAEARKETRTHSPSKVYYDLGRNMMYGLQDGLNSINPSMNMPVTGKTFLNGGNGYGTNTGSPIHMEVNAMQSESLDSTLKRASFRMRTRT